MTEILTVSSLTLTLKSILDILSANGELKYETVKRQSGWEGGGGGGGINSLAVNSDSMLSACPFKISL